MAERSNAAVLKTVDPKGPGVRIPLSPLFLGNGRNLEVLISIKLYSCNSCDQDHCIYASIVHFLFRYILLKTLPMDKGQITGRCPSPRPVVLRKSNQTTLSIPSCSLKGMFNTYTARWHSS